MSWKIQNKKLNREALEKFNQGKTFFSDINSRIAGITEEKNTEGILDSIAQCLPTYITGEICYGIV